MGNFLRKLRISKVDLVDKGANQYAHIRLAKRKDDDEPENSIANDKPEIVTDDGAFFERFGRAIAKLFSRAADEADAADSEEKSQAISDALKKSLDEISSADLTDDERKAAVIKTADEVAETVKEEYGGIDIMQELKEALESPIEVVRVTDEELQADAEDFAAAKENVADEPQEGCIDMIFDTDRMTEAEKAQLDALIKAYGHENEGEDVAKRLTPEIETELEQLRKYKSEAEDRELQQVAKKYEIIGKKAEELAPVLKSLKAADAAAYEAMIATLDSAVEAVNNSAMFTEIGKRGTETEGDAWSKIEAAAQEIMKSREGMRYADAVEAACNAHPELVREYEKNR